jgi:hypothetical protein
MASALRRGFLLPKDDICNIGEIVINVSPLEATLVYLP